MVWFEEESSVYRDCREKNDEYHIQDCSTSSPTTKALYLVCIYKYIYIKEPYNPQSLTISTL